MKEPAEQDADMARLNRDSGRQLVARSPFGHHPLALGEQPMDECADCFRQRLIDGVSGNAALPVRLGNRQSDHGGLMPKIGPIRRQRDVLRLKRRAIAGHRRTERRVDDALNRRRRAKARMEKRAPRAARRKHVADLLIRLDVGAPEPVNRLLRIADDEQFARMRRDPAPIGFGGIVGRQQHQDLGLQRIAVLELVDEDPREAGLKRAADLGVAGKQIAAAQEQVDEVERAGTLLQPFVSRNGLAQLDVQERGEVGVGGALKPIERAHRRLVRGPNGVAWDIRAVHPFATAAGPAQIPVLREIDQPRFQSVFIQ